MKFLLKIQVIFTNPSANILVSYTETPFGTHGGFEAEQSLGRRSIVDMGCS